MLRLLAVVIALVAGLGSGFASTTQPASAAGAQLSPVGQDAMADLRECVATGSHLNVYYLLDASGSLEDTDPGNIRAELLANSLRELGDLKDGLTVSYAVGFFSTEFRQALGWTEVASPDIEADRLRSLVTSEPTTGWTNWRDGILAAQQQLAAQAAGTGGCQLLVWLTDGAINIDGDSDALDDAAINDLCGAPVRPGAAPSLGYGPFNESRQAGTVVVGVLLRDAAFFAARDEQYIPYMRALVEGETVISGSQVVCGQHPIPEGYASGALLEATSANDLALVFLQIGTLVNGGFPSPFGPDGTFMVDPGVSTFSLITGSTEWNLVGPGGQHIDPANAAASGVTMDTSGGATRLTIAPDSSDIGRWTWASTTPSLDGLYFTSGLKLELDEPGTFLAGADNALTGRIVRTDGRDIPLSAYRFDLQLAIVEAGTSTPIRPDSIVVDEATGEFAFHYAATQASGVVVFEAQVRELSTTPSGTSLAPVAASLDVTVTVPDQYPSIEPQSMTLSDLVGRDGLAEGTFTLQPPRDGTTGEVCFGNAVPRVTVDAADRADQWTWRLDAAEECIAVVPGSPVTLTLSAANPIAANSAVEAVLAVEYRSEAGEAIQGSVPVSFASIRPIDAVAFGLSFVLLLVLGVLLPLVLLWALNYVTHKLTFGRELARASLRVSVDPDGVVRGLDGTELRAHQFGTDEFAFQPVRSPARSHQDQVLGTLRARVPFWPLAMPWFEIVPPAGSVVIGPGGRLPASRARSAERGSIAGIPGDVGGVWGLVISEAAIRDSTDRTPGTLVVYLRGSEYGARMAKVLAADPIKRQLARIRAAVKGAAPRDTRTAASAPSDAMPAPRARAAGEPPAPPRRGGRSEPPPPGRRPGFDGVPPTRAVPGDPGGPPPGSRDVRPPRSDDPPPPPRKR